jgi:HlyD family secretion protein
MNQVVMSNKSRSSIMPKLLMALPLVIVVGAGALYINSRANSANSGQATATHLVGLRNLDVTVRKDGELQAVNNIDIISEVEGSVTIQSIVREGSSVKKGETLVVLDSANTRQRIDDVTLEVQRAEADVVNAREMLEIQKSQNATNLEAAEVALENAQIDLKKFTEGDFPKNLATARASLQMAEINLKNLEQDFKQVQDLAARGFLTPTDVKAREVQLIKARNDLNDAQTGLRNLQTFDQQKSLTSLRSQLAQSEARLVRVQRENTANLTQRETDLSAREQTLDMKRRQLERLQRQLAASTIVAPEDGLVVYATSGDRNAQQPIQEGAQVRERQMILRLPDTSRMRAVVRIQEAQVTRLQPGQKAMVNITGLPKPVTGVVTKISVLADSSQRWWNPDLKEYPVDIDLDETPPGLKPGVGAAAEIFIARLENVIAVPVSTIYTAGQRSYVFRKPVGDGSPTPLPIHLGMASDTHVQVTEGLAEGDEILVLQAGQGRELLAKAGIKEEAATRPSWGPRGGGENAGGPPQGGPPQGGPSQGGPPAAGGASGNWQQGAGGTGNGSGRNWQQGGQGGEAAPAGGERRRRPQGPATGEPQSAAPATRPTQVSGVPAN